MAEILKNKINIGTSAIKNIVVTDAYGNDEIIKYVKSVKNASDSDIKYDIFKEFVFGDIVIDSLTCADVPASGGSVTPIIRYHQSKTKKGYSGTVYSSTVANLTTNATISYYRGSETPSNKFDGIISAQSLGSTEKSRTKLQTVLVKVEMNGKTAYKSVDVFQSLNRIESYQWQGDINLTIGNITEPIPASGGTVVCPEIKTVSIPYKKIYSSGTQVPLTQTTLNSCTVTYGTSPTSITETVRTNVKITGQDLGSELKDQRTIGNFYVKVVNTYGQSGIASTPVIQSPNEFTHFEYDTPTFVLSIDEDIEACGGVSAMPRISGIRQTRYYCYSAGHKKKSDVITENTLLAESKLWNKSQTTYKDEIVRVESQSSFIYFKCNKESTSNPPFGRFMYQNGDFVTDREGNLLLSEEINTEDYEVICCGYFGLNNNPTNINAEFGTAYFPSLKAEVKPRSQVGTTYAKLYLNGKTSEVVSAPIYQKENVFNHFEYGEINLIVRDVPPISAKGGISEAPVVNFTQEKFSCFTSGHKQSSEILRNQFEPENTRQWSREVVHKDDVVYFESESGNKEFYRCIVDSTTNPPFKRFMFSDGDFVSDSNGDWLFASEVNTSEYTLVGGIFFGKSPNPVSTNPDEARYEAFDLTNKTTAKKNLGKIYVKVIANGYSMEVSKNVDQEANQIVGYTYNGLTVKLNDIADIPETGGVSSTPYVSYSQTRIYNYTSGPNRYRDTITSGAKITWDTKPELTGKEQKECVFKGENLGTTEKPRTLLGTVYAKVVLNGESAIVSQNVYQKTNSIKYTSYGTPTFIGAFSYDTFPAVGGTFNPSSIPTYNQVRTDTYTSNASKATNLTSGGTIVFSKTNGDKFTLNKDGSVTTSNNTTFTENTGVIGMTVSMNGKTSSRLDTNIKQNATRQFVSGNTYYGMSDIVKVGENLYVPNQDTSNSPVFIYTDSEGNRLLYDDNFYILTDTENSEEYTKL